MGPITPGQASQTASDHRNTRTAAGPASGDGDVGPSPSTPGTSTPGRRGERRRRPIASRAGAEGAGADPRRNGDDYPMTSLSDGLGPHKDPNSGRTRVDLAR